MEQCLLASLIITLIHVSLMWEGMILYEVGSRLEYMSKSKFWAVLLKPLFTCLVCMCSVWGIIIWRATGGPWSLEMVQFILAVGGINVIISSLIGPRHFQDQFNSDN